MKGCIQPSKQDCGRYRRSLAIGIVTGRRGRDQARQYSSQAQGVAHAERAARTIANSLLVKPVCTRRPELGRLVSGRRALSVPFDLSSASVHIGGLVLFEKGQPHDRTRESCRCLGRKKRSLSKSTSEPGGTSRHNMDVRSSALST